MSYVKPLTMAAAMALAFIGLDAHAASPSITINFNPTSPQTSTPHQATYYVANYGTPQARKVYYFDRLDRDHDGQLSRSEIPKDMRQLRLHFIQADWDESGKLSPEEYVLYKHNQTPQYAGVYHAIVFVYRH